MKDDYAFPRPTNHPTAPGMELRDWFAGQIACASIANDGFPEHPGILTMIAYTMAEQMMRVRNMTLDELTEYAVEIAASLAEDMFDEDELEEDTND
jgi:hypothetical protein